MCFYNHCLEGETITAVVAFPFTPTMIREMNEVQVFALGKTLGLTFTEDCGIHPGELFRQKLYDMWYFVEDSSRMHAIVPCQSQLRKCSNLASGLSGNFMCKVCQLDLQNREPSLIHDSHDQFFRHKIRSMYEFEESHGFDRKRTIRVTMRRLIKKYDLERMFQDYSVDFAKMEVLHSSQTHRIQYIYLPCSTPDEAKRIMQFKSMICAKLGREDIKLESLCNNLVKSHQKYREPEKVCVLVTPPSSMEVVEELPKAEDLIAQILNVVQMVTQLEPHQISLETDINTITGEKDYRHVFVSLPNRQFVDRVYEAQPFFGCLVCHKLVHPQVTPFLRFSSDVCLMCPNLKDANNLMDMCLDCAAKQKVTHIVCPTVAPKVQELQLRRKEFAKERGVPLDAVCEKSPNLKLKGDPNNLSKAAYLVQASSIKELRHERSCYWEHLKELKPVEMSRAMISQVAEMHIKLRNDLRNGRYDWFKPIYGSNIEEYMIKANKELQEVVDNGNLMRGHTTKKMLKEGKIFTFQANLPIAFKINPRVNVYENIDQKGVPFVEYSYDRPNPRELWTKNSSNKQRTYSYTDFFNHAKSPNLEIKDNFHLMFMGLDRINLTIKELSQEIYIKIKTLVGEISPTQIMIIDNESIRGRQV